MERLFLKIPPARRLDRSLALIENVPFLVRGPAVVYEPTTGTPVGELLKPHRTALHEDSRLPAYTVT